MFKKVRHKFGAKPTTKDGIKFSSKLEASYYQKLKILQQAGEVVGFLRQVPIHFQCGTKYVLDFLVFFQDETVEAWEIKGIETPVWKIKYKMLQDEYPWLEIKVLK